MIDFKTLQKIVETAFWEEYRRAATANIIFPWLDEHGYPLTIYGTWHTRKPPGKTPKKYAAPNPEVDGKDFEATKRSPLYFDRARKAGHKHIVNVEGLTDAGIAQVRGTIRSFLCGLIVGQHRIPNLAAPTALKRLRLRIRSSLTMPS